MLHCDIVAIVSSNTAKVWIQPASQGQRVFFRQNKSTYYFASQNDGRGNQLVRIAPCGIVRVVLMIVTSLARYVFATHRL